MERKKKVKKSKRKSGNRGIRTNVKSSTRGVKTRGRGSSHIAGRFLCFHSARLTVFDQAETRRRKKTEPANCFLLLSQSSFHLFPVISPLPFSSFTYVDRISFVACSVFILSKLLTSFLLLFFCIFCFIVSPRYLFSIRSIEKA